MGDAVVSREEAGEAVALLQNRWERMLSSGGGSVSKASRRSAAGPRAEKSRACFSFFVYLSLSLWAASSSRKCGRCDMRGGETTIIRCPVLERW